ncbi:MAG: hypothetical protein AAGI52_11175 [Bacteroidota bacterium]
MRLATATLLALLGVALLSAPHAQSLDSSYGSGGFATLELGGNRLDVTDLILDRKDRATVVATRGARTSLIGRAAPDGQSDGSFGTDGRVQVEDAVLQALFATDDDRLFAVGRSESEAVLIRFSEDGSEDPADGGGRWAYTLGQDTEATAIAGVRIGVLALAVTVRTEAGFQCGVLLVDEDGDRIPSFGSDGLALVPGPTPCASAAVVPYGSGIALVGDAETSADERAFLVALFDATGAPDASFGTGGISLDGFPDDLPRATDAQVAPNGDLVVAGSLAKGETVGILLLRLRPDGSRAAFGDNGFTWTPHPNSNVDFTDGATALAIDANGRLLVSTTADRGDVRASVARYGSDGRLDGSFSGDGIQRFPIPAGDPSEASDIAVDRFGQVYVAGTAQTASGRVEAFIFRLEGGAAVANEEAPAAPAIRLAPNPTRNDAWVTLERPGTVTVLDPLGRVVLETSGFGRLALPMGRLAPGAYSVLVDTGAGRAVSRLTVVR